MEEEHLAEVACKCLNLECPAPRLEDWRAMIDAWKHPEHSVTIALVGKYTQLHDAYISVVEALKHGGVACRASVDIRWIDSETVTREMWTSFSLAPRVSLFPAVLATGALTEKSLPSAMPERITFPFRLVSGHWNRGLRTQSLWNYCQPVMSVSLR